jgi:choline dehydrogenase/5-(hydroxymethyl)furfural/furfural oxidase
VRGVVLASDEVIEASEVWLAAGAIHSPVLLLRSGLDWPGVGEGLADHPSVALTLRLRPEAILPAGRPVLATLLRAPGDLQVLALGATGHDEVGRRHGALIVAAMASRSIGRVGVRGDGSPDVVLGLLGEAADRVALRAGARLLVQLATQPAFERLIEAAVTDDGTPLDALAGGDDDVLDRWIATGAGPYTHAACSCARAVDDWGRLPGVRGLRVVDASTLPANPAANPHLSVLAWAERAAGMH